MENSAREKGKGKGKAGKGASSKLYVDRYVYRQVHKVD